jgi:glycosyltransferase involved in cell wall biosynthesis
MPITRAPLITVIVPARNEGLFLERCLRSIMDLDYPRTAFEILVVDGMSTDETKHIIESFAAIHSQIKYVANPQRITSAALNRGIGLAKGDLIAWMSAHNEYDRDYLKLCAEYHGKFQADNVGGVIVTLPRTNSVLGRAIANALSHPFGVGPSHFRTHTDQPMYADTVFGGCYRREVFDKVGLFNESLVRGQDMEFNLRLRRAGCRILLVPAIRSKYFARSRLGDFIQYNWINGLWTLRPFLYSEITPIRLRHLVPMFFVLALIATGMGCVVTHKSCLALGTILTAYAALAVAASVDVARRSNELALMSLMPIVFLSLHISFGVGCVFGLIETLAKPKWIIKRLLRPAKLSSPFISPQ